MRHSNPIHIMLALGCCVLPLGWVGEVTSIVEQQARPGESPVSAAAKGTEVAGRVLDGLGRPVGGVRVKLTSSALGPLKPPIVVTSGDDGRFRCTVAEKVDDVDLVFEKDGYIKNSATFQGGRPEDLTVFRDWREIRLHTEREGDELVQEMREFLATGDEGGGREEERLRYLFKHHVKLRRAMRPLVGDAHVGEEAQDLLDLFGDPADRDLFPEGRKYAPKHEVQEDDLVEAIKAIARHVNFFSKRPEPKIDIDSITFNPEMDRALVQCGINMAPLTGIVWRFVFHKEGKRWVLRSMQEAGRG